MGVLFKNLLRLLVMSLELIDESGDFLPFRVILELEVRKDDIEVDGILIALVSPARRGLSILTIMLIRVERIVVRLCLAHRSFPPSRLLEQFKDAISFQFLLDDILEDLNVVALLLICYRLFTKGLLDELVLA